MAAYHPGQVLREPSALHIVFMVVHTSKCKVKLAGHSLTPQQMLGRDQVQRRETDCFEDRDVLRGTAPCRWRF